MNAFAPIDISYDPINVLQRWPADRPVVMLHSGRAHRRFARWTMFALPQEWQIVEEATSESLGILDIVRSGDRGAKRDTSSALPFAGGWIVALSYDLGRALEPACATDYASERNRSWPDIALARCDDALLFEHETNTWHAIGDVAEILDAIEATSVDEVSFDVGALRSNVATDEYCATVERIREYIAAGDVYQVNLTRRLSANFRGSTRALAACAFQQSRPWYGAYLELPRGRTLLSLSPELFLQIDGASRTIVTRPIKGTLAASRHARELVASEKDAAELHMIVDLMRNDLGRVCEVGSVRVVTPRVIETHPTVHHGVAEIEGVLRSGITFGELLHATFPAGSVTGAPKIRAMQIIDELESVRRSPYCGSIGFIDDAGNATLNVAIRTLAISGMRACERWDCFEEATLDYGTGGGIVADSIPEREWEETEQKAAVLRTTLQLQKKPRSANAGFR